VIHYDPWWNPAVEAQGMIEERILVLHERKAALSQSMYNGVTAQAAAVQRRRSGGVAETAICLIACCAYCTRDGD